MFQNLAAKEKKEFWLLNPDKISKIFFYLLIIFLPTQFGKHFWPDFSFVFGLRLDYLSPTLYATDILIFLIIIFSFKNIIRFIKGINKNNKKILLFLIISLTFGSIFSKNPYAAVYGLIKLIEIIFLATYITQKFKTFSKKNLFVAFSIPLIFESLLVFAQTLNKGSLGGVMYYLGERAYNSSTPGIANASVNGELFLRPYATFPHPNVLAAFLVAYMLLLFYVFPKNFKKYLYILLSIGTACLLLTLSRTEILYWIISLLCIFVISIFKKYKNRKINIRKQVFFLIPLLIIAFGIFQNSLIIQRFLQTRISDESFAQRQELVSTSIKIFSDNPIFGTGPNNFFYHLPNTGLIQPVHNIFLLILSETGIIVFFIFLYFLVKLFYGTIKTKNKYLILLFLSFIVFGSIDHFYLTLQQGQIITALIFGIIFSQKYKEKF